MNQEHEAHSLDPRMQNGVTELEERISAKFPTTTFEVQQGVDDPEQTWLVATVDIDDPDEVIDLVVDRLLELQIDEHVPLHVLPIHTPERVAQTLSRRRNAASSHVAQRYTQPPLSLP